MYLKSVIKYQVNALGNYVAIKKEKRQMTIKYDWNEKLMKRKKIREKRKKIK